MRGAADALARKLDAITWSLPKIPVIQNVEAKSYANIQDIRGALARQLYSPVRWTESVQQLAARGATRVAECGPGKVLTGLLKRIDRTLDGRAIGAPGDMTQALGEWSGESR
jgi:[acyl-carrier-protein] S-malonyltransferase